MTLRVGPVGRVGLGGDNKLGGGSLTRWEFKVPNCLPWPAPTPNCRSQRPLPLRFVDSPFFLVEVKLPLGRESTARIAGI